LTNEKFVENPFFLIKRCTRPRHRSLVSDGNIEYLGREDHQVKYGLRTELVKLKIPLENILS
jgi:non-ribosomal peptide synthetase component F